VCSRLRHNIIIIFLPYTVSKTFILIFCSLSVSQTISDARQAFRNVSSIVRDTIGEASRDPAASSTAAGDQMMMAAANTADNEIGGGSASTTPDPRIAGQTLGKLLGRNYRGLRRLFNSELRSAVKVGIILLYTLQLSCV